jgi:hypothetical protein
VRTDLFDGVSGAPERPLIPSALVETFGGADSGTYSGSFAMAEV